MLIITIIYHHSSFSSHLLESVIHFYDLFGRVAHGRHLHVDRFELLIQADLFVDEFSYCVFLAIHLRIKLLLFCFEILSFGVVDAFFYFLHVLFFLCFENGYLFLVLGLLFG